MKSANSYDPDDNVRRHGLIRANGLKLASYSVRLGEDEWSERQFHYTYDNHVVAMLPQSALDRLISYFEEYGMAPAAYPFSFSDGAFVGGYDVVQTGDPDKLRLVVMLGSAVLAVLTEHDLQLIATFYAKIDTTGAAA